MKRIFILLLVVIFTLPLLVGCGKDIASAPNQNSQEERTQGGDNFSWCKHPDEISGWYHTISTTFMKYLGSKAFDYIDTYIQMAEEGKASYENLSLPGFFKDLGYTPDEVLSLLEYSNECNRSMGMEPEYSEDAIKLIMAEAFGDETIRLNNKVQVVFKANGYNGYIFGTEQIADMKKSGGTAENSIPSNLLLRIGVKSYNEWVDKLESPSQYTIQKFLTDFDIPMDWYDTCMNVAAQSKGSIYTQELYEKVRADVYRSKMGDSYTPAPKLPIYSEVLESESEKTSYPWNTPEEKSAYYASSEAMMAQNQPQSTVTQQTQSPVTSQ